MCVISMVADDFTTKIEPLGITGIGRSYFPEVSKLEFEQLKAEVLELKELLKKAKVIDEALGTPDCETEEKFELIRKVAELVGVDLEDVINT